VIIDMSGAARTPDAEKVRAWLSDQRVFISGAMGDTAAERRAVADAVAQEGASPVLFEDFGRDADAEEAYLTEVDSSTIYVAILNEMYGRLNPPGFSATEAEFLRARQGGKRISVFTAEPAPGREGHLARFIQRARVSVTTNAYESTEDLIRRVRRRLHELASQSLSPWVKLGELVFRADEIDDRGSEITIRARVSEEIAFQLDVLRGDGTRRPGLRLTHGGRVRDGEFTGLRRTTRAAGADDVAIELTRVTPPSRDSMRFGVGGLTADEIVERGLRSQLLGEDLPSHLSSPFSIGAEATVACDDLRQAFELPNEFAEPITRLVLTDALVGGGKARRVITLSVGPRTGATRRLELEWEDASPYENAPAHRRRLEGDWVIRSD
jgi:hypothetical protein